MDFWPCIRPGVANVPDRIVQSAVGNCPQWAGLVYARTVVNLVE